MMRLVAALIAAIGLVVAPGTADDPASAALTVTPQGFVDGHGRTVVLRGFNVSGEAKLAENGGLPFATAADADRSAAAMQRLTGANAVRFLLTWEGIQPAPGQLDTAYLGKAVDQLRPFLDRGFHVFLDFHQDLYSRYLFNPDSWYTGDGAPRWVVEAGDYPREFCGICVQWGQNITQNAAVQDATYDFWHNRYGVQDAFLDAAAGTLRYVREHLTTAQFARILGADPWNEPYAGRYDSGQNSQSWERDVLWPLYLKFRQRMDAAGWSAKPALVQPNLFWNANLFFVKQEGGLANVGAIGTRFVFNTHFYDQAALSGIFLPGNAYDGRYSADFATVRQRAAALGTAAMVSEFGSPVTGHTSDKTPSVLKGVYQALDSPVRGADWWSSPQGSVLSSTQWQWDIYNGAHHEAMNGNPDKVQTEGDAWNGEDFSAVRDTALRLDAKLLDRVYPRAVASTPLAFTYEDRAWETWNPVPTSLPNLRAVVGDGQYAVLVWRAGGDGAPTELHLPATFPAAGTTVLTDTTATVAPGQLSLSADGGSLHYALITNGAPVSSDVRAAALRELAGWVGAKFA